MKEELLDSPVGPTSTGVDERLSTVLCYAAWWVTGLVFLLLERDNRTVRFHAAQSVVVFGALSVVMGLVAALSATTLFLIPSVFRWIWGLNYLVWFAAVGLWLVLMLRSLKGETWRVPVAADVADRIAGT